MKKRASAANERNMATTFHFLLGPNILTYVNLDKLENFYDKIKNQKNIFIAYHPCDEDTDEHIHCMYSVPQKYAHQKLPRVYSIEC